MAGVSGAVSGVLELETESQKKEYSLIKTMFPAVRFDVWHSLKIAEDDILVWN